MKRTMLAPVCVGLSFLTALSCHAQNEDPYANTSIFNAVQRETKLDTKTLKHILGLWKETERKWVPAFRKQYHVLPALINKHNLKVGCEVGQAFGTQVEETLNKSGARVFGIDPYRPYKDKAFGWANQQHWDVMSEFVRARLAHYGNRYEHIRLPSTQAVTLFEDNSLDFVYLDGDHSYESIKNDLHVWWHKVKPGGFLCGDDYCKGWPTVMRAVNEFLKEKGVKKVDAGIRIYIIQKPAA